MNLDNKYKISECDIETSALLGGQSPVTSAEAPTKSDVFQKTKKNLMSVKRFARNSDFWGQKWLCQFYGRLEKLRSFCRKKPSMPIKFLVLGGAFWVFWGGGGGGEPTLFLWARGFFLSFHTKKKAQSDLSGSKGQIWGHF